jgi:MFS family permease
MPAASQAGRRGGWYYGWNIVAVCIFSQVAANGLTYNAFSLFLKDWSAQLHTPVSVLQLPIAAMVWVAAFISPLIGTFADKYPPRRLFGVGLLGMAAFYVAVSFATATWQIILLYAALAPLAVGLSTAIPANAVISRWFVRRRGVALGLSAFGIGLAGIVLPPIIADVLPQIGWRMVWRIGALIIAVVVTPIVLWVLRDRPTEREGLHYLEGEAGGHAHHGHGGGAFGLKQVLARRNFWLLMAIYLPILAIQGGMNQNIGPYALNHGLSQQVVGTLIPVLSISHVTATLVLGWMSDRFGNRLPFAGLAATVAAGAATLAFAQGLPAILAGCVLVGLGGGLFTLLAAALAAEFGADGFGRAFGTAMAFLPLASFAPFLIAKSQETTGSYAPALLAFGALVLVGGGLILMLRERRGGHLTAEEKEAAALDEAANPIV